MSVAVIIPIYNSQKYISEAIDSCLLQKEVKQIILVDDCSEDDSLEICQRYVQKHDCISINCHDTNKGRSAARNTGMKEVKTALFTFLDADDYYRNNRFRRTVTTMTLLSGIDGIYESVVSQFEKEEGVKLYQKVTGINQEVLPENLFNHLLLSKEHFSIIGCTFRSSTIIHHFWFDESLEVAEDTDFIWRVARRRSLQGIQTDPSVVRRVHGGNTAFNKELTLKGKYQLYKKWKNNLDRHKLNVDVQKKIITAYSHYKSLQNSISDNQSLFEQRLYQGVELFRRPSLWPSFFR